MQKIKLKNGLTVIHQKKKGDSVAVEVLVKAGSNNEKAGERGISHFIEHLVFDGTKKRKTGKEIANEIERVGGELNAYTTNERTCFYVKVLKKHFELALDILADILQNPLFEKKEIENEKKVVGKEIDLVNDQPRSYQWILLEKNLFEKHPIRFPTYGEKKVIKRLGRKKVADYYNRHYAPNKMVLAIVGEAGDWEKKVKEKFVAKRGGKEEEIKIKEPLAKKNKSKKEKRKIKNTYLVLGYKTVPRGHKDSYVLDVINGILGRGQSGKMFEEIRGKRGLAYEVGTQHLGERGCGYFAVYASTDKEKVGVVKKIILEELEKLKKVTARELAEAKDHIEGSYRLEMEDSQRLADGLCFWEQIEKAEKMKEFVGRVKKVSVEDVRRVAEKYFRNYCLCVVEGK